MSAEAFHNVLRTSHIVLGTAGLLVFWLPALSRKGGPTHVASGRIFKYIAYAVAATAAVSCIWAVASPLSFAGIARELTIDEQAELSGNIRFLFVILFTLMTWLVSGTAMGTHVAKEKQDFRINSRLVKFWWLVSGWISAACGGYGIYLLLDGNVNGVLLGFLALVGISDSRKNLLSLRTPIESAHIWIEKHIECMIGSGIAMHTAFFVFGGKRFFGELDGVLALLPWILPAAIGISAIILLIRRERAKHAKPTDHQEAI